MISRVEPTFVLIGAGGISKAYAQAFANGLPYKLVGVADIRKEAAEEVAEIVGAKSYDDIEIMCAELQPTAAIVCTPPNTHAAICIELMNLGIHVLCEKPLAVTSQDARRMISAADANNVTFTMGSKFRFVEDVQEARRIIESGKLGDIVLFENTFAGFCDMSQRWNSNPEISGGGVLIDNGTHSIDIMRFLLGSVTELQVVEGRRIQNLAVEDTARLFVRNEAGAMGSIDLSWSMNKVQPHFISIYGSKGTLLVGWQESKFQLAGESEWTVFGNGYDKVGAFSNQLSNFAAAIKGEEELIINSNDALASVMTMETAYEALKSSEWHPVAQTHEQWVRGGVASKVE
ncbi:Gfo/Idh/MocA family protein [Fuerstiella marisgermanici]|uniref:Putative oxidoreductase YcjS n=1 Tax=Fuerstiella marisgermanici TaxID=1891926 RepID=A0A1P8WNC6_9PLAN|nr:Gfo/Idh/MocA family oxidoreductase [Fuerstiella marisgermanici]APZ95560.1 putative oxidoreductase YcjS [Fuerstiella marisgermanici]